MTCANCGATQGPFVVTPTGQRVCPDTKPCLQRRANLDGQRYGFGGPRLWMKFPRRSSR